METQEYVVSKETFRSIKKMLKLEAKELRECKVNVKNTQRGGSYAGQLQAELISKRWHWRHKFIAYCQLRGTALDQIEGKHREGNEPNEALVEKYYEGFING